MKFSAIFLTIFGLLFSAASSANSIQAKVVKVGCHINAETCYVYLDKPITSDCTHKSSLRWGTDSSKNANIALSLLLAAKAANQTVEFGGIQGCHASYPTFAFVSVL